MAPRARTEEQILASIKTKTVDAPEVKRQPRPSGPRVPELPVIPGLVDDVWDSYTSGGTYKFMSVPPSFVDRVRMELQAARRFVEYQHRNDDPRPDIRGLVRPEIDVIDPDNPKEEHVKYVRAIGKGEVGVLWRARPPEPRGIRARRLAEQGVTTRQTSRAAYKREWRAKQKEKAAAASNGHSSGPPPVVDPFKH